MTDEELISSIGGAKKYSSDDEIMKAIGGAKQVSTNWKEDLAIGVADTENTFRKGFQFLSSPFLDTYAKLRGKDPDEIFQAEQQMQEANMRAANPENKPQSFAGKAISMGPKMLAFPGMLAVSPFDTAARFLDAGETKGKAAAAMGVDAAGGALGMLPMFGPLGKTMTSRVLTAGTGNAVQDSITNKVIKEIADTEQMKEAFDPTLEKAALSFMVAMPFAALSKPRVDSMEGFDDPLARKTPEPPVDAAPAEKPIPEVLKVSSKGDVYDPNTPDVELWRARAEAKALAERYGITEEDINQSIREGVVQKPQETTPARPMAEIDAEADAMKQQQQDALWKEREAEINARKALEEDIQKTESYDVPAPDERVSKGQQRKSSFQRKQGGYIDPQLFDPLFKKVKDIAHGFKLRIEGSTAGPVVYASINGKDVGSVAFESTKGSSDINVRSTGDAVSEWTTVDQGFRGQGLATQMYKFASENGADIVPSLDRTPDGEALWRGLEQRGISQDGRIPRKQSTLNQGMSRGQRGGLAIGDVIDAFNEKAERVKKIVDLDWTMDKPKAETVIEQSLKAAQQKPMTKTAQVTQAFEAGSTLRALKTKHPLTRAVGGLGQWASNISDKNIRDWVLPTQKIIRSVAPAEWKSLMRVMEDELAQKSALSPEELLARGLSPEAISFRDAFRDISEKVLARENKAREAMGKSPITPEEFYTSHRWVGDWSQSFKKPVMEQDGTIKKDSKGEPVLKTIWQLRGKNARDLRLQRERLLKAFPDLVPGKERTKRLGKANTDNPEILYKEMMDLFGKDDVVVKQIKEWYENELQQQSRDTLAQEKHFKKKTGVRGYVGDRPSNSLDILGSLKERKLVGKYDSDVEAREYFKQQMTQMKNALKWAALQEAGVEMKKILASKELQEKAPREMNYARNYWKKQLGFDEAELVRLAEHKITEYFGSSPGAQRELVGGVKSAWVAQKLLSLPFATASVLQAADMVPHIADVAVKTGGSPISAIGGMITGALYLGLGHLTAKINPVQDSPNYTKATTIIHTGFGEFNAAMRKYAEDNGVTSRSIADESPIDIGVSPVKAAANIGMKGVMLPELLIRSMAFGAFSHQLKDSGKFKDLNTLFQEAERRTNAAFGDYRSGEKPMAFTKGGITTDTMSTLQTYTAQFVSQYDWALREAYKGNVLPLVTRLGVHFYMAGVMGIPGFQDLDKVWEAIKGWLASQDPEAYDYFKDADLKEMVMDTMGASGVYGDFSDATGVGMTSRLSGPSLLDSGAMLPNILGDLGGQAMAWGELALDPSKDKLVKATMKSLPTGLQGAFEVGPFRDNLVVGEGKDGATYRSPGSSKGSFERTPEEESMRAWGFRSQSEVQKRDADWRLTQKETQLDKALTSTRNKLINAINSGDKEKAQRMFKLYATLNKNPIDDATLERLILESRVSREKGQVLRGLPSKYMELYKRAQTWRDAE